MKYEPSRRHNYDDTMLIDCCEITQTQTLVDFCQLCDRLLVIVQFLRAIVDVSRVR